MSKSDGALNSYLRKVGQVPLLTSNEEIELGRRIRNGDAAARERMIHVCEEYRAAATIDVEHDRADKEASRRIECPMLHLWGKGGPLDTFYAKDGGPLGIWRQWAPRVQGQAMKGGHFFPEDNPDDTAALVKQFLSG